MWILKGWEKGLRQGLRMLSVKEVRIDFEGSALYLDRDCD